VSEPARISLRLLGFVLLLIGIGLLILLLVPGPGEIADWMGESCAHRRRGPSEQCNVLDVIGVLLAGPLLILVGGVMALALRPPGKGPITLDLSGRR